MKTKFSSVALRVTAVIAALLLFVAAAAYGVMWILVNGPSPTARRLFVLSVKETSAGGFLADMYLSEAEIAEILGTNGGVEASTEQVDVSLIEIPTDTTVTMAPSGPDTETATDTPSSDTDTEVIPDDPMNDIEILDVAGDTFNGKLMIISDPKRVFVGVPDSFGASSSGLSVAAMIQKYDCVAGTNAGGFEDEGGRGTGGIPDGIVIYEGELLWGQKNGSYSIAGLDKDGVLHVGMMTGERALELGIEYAASYGPALIINGRACNERYSLGGGLNPRTAIGQRADGAILLLVVNGRSLESLGATFDDLVDVMLAHGAVNATNLDGGSSSLMIVNGEYLTDSAYIFGERVVATAILVK